MWKLFTFLFCILFSMDKITAQEIFPLYQDKIPNSKPASNEEKTEENKKKRQGKTPIQFQAKITQ